MHDSQNAGFSFVWRIFVCSRTCRNPVHVYTLVSFGGEYNLQSKWATWIHPKFNRMASFGTKGRVESVSSVSHWEAIVAESCDCQHAFRKRRLAHECSVENTHARFDLFDLFVCFV